MMPDNPPTLTPDEKALLEAIFTYIHPTTEQLWRLVAPDRPKRYVERGIERLRTLGLIEARLLRPEEGARSARYYHLLLLGARMIGKTRLGSEHYRIEGRDAFAARSARIELDLLIRQAGWGLFRQEAEMRQALLAYLEYLAASEHGERAPTHTLATLLPVPIAPDLALVTHAEVIPVVIAHPHAGGAFWRARLIKYTPIITRVRAIGVALSPEQRREAQAVIRQSAWPRRYLILEPEELSTLQTRLA